MKTRKNITYFYYLLSTYLQLGSGNFGEVFNGIATGIHSESSTKVALKFLIGNEKKSAVFLKEITAISQLKHKNIVEFYGVCLDSNCIVMELMEGGQLHEYLITQSQNLNLYDLIGKKYTFEKYA